MPTKNDQANGSHRPIIAAILAELRRAEQKHPYWPTDPIHAAAILGEESGELTQASLDYVYSGGTMDRIREEAVQCGAMAVRLLLNLPHCLSRQ